MRNVLFVCLILFLVFTGGCTEMSTNCYSVCKRNGYLNYINDPETSICRCLADNGLERDLLKTGS